jgi:hypothetical protein
MSTANLRQSGEPGASGTGLSVPQVAAAVTDRGQWSRPGGAAFPPGRGFRSWRLAGALVAGRVAATRCGWIPRRVTVTGEARSSGLLLPPGLGEHLVFVQVAEEFIGLQVEAKPVAELAHLVAALV